MAQCMVVFLIPTPALLALMGHPEHALGRGSS